MIERVSKYIKGNTLLSKEKLYIVALSGGADSVALLRVLLAIGYHVEAAHCNFHLRGEESDRDEMFVVDLCEKLSVPLHRAHFDTIAYARLHKVSIEMAARQLRYRYFEQICHDIGADGICVGHHRDDHVETILINMLRGTGIHGMVGIRPKREINSDKGDISQNIEETSPEKSYQVIRPLLCVNHSEITSWLHDIHQDFVTDSSNFEDDVIRNKIRLNIIPELLKINPAAISNLQHTAEEMAEAERVYNAYIEEQTKILLKDNHMDIELLSQTASPQSVLYEWLTPFGFSPSTIRQIYENMHTQTGHYWSSSTHEVYTNRGKLVLVQQQEELRPLRIPETGNYTYHESLHFRVSIEPKVIISRQSDCATLDAEKVSFPLILRVVKEGDQFIPFGMQGKRLISDFLTDLKVPLYEKRRQLIVEDSTGEIVWVVGLRTSNNFRITNDTQRMLKLSVTK